MTETGYAETDEGMKNEWLKTGVERILAGKIGV